MSGLVCGPISPVLASTSIRLWPTIHAPVFLREGQAGEPTVVEDRLELMCGFQRKGAKVIARAALIYRWTQEAAADPDVAELLATMSARRHETMRGLVAIIDGAGIRPELAHPDLFSQPPT